MRHSRDKYVDEGPFETTVADDLIPVPGGGAEWAGSTSIVARAETLRREAFAMFEEIRHQAAIEVCQKGLDSVGANMRDVYRELLALGMCTGQDVAPIVAAGKELAKLDGWYTGGSRATGVGKPVMGSDSSLISALDKARKQRQQQKKQVE